MIQKFIEAWDEHKKDLRDKYSQTHPDNYTQVVRDVVSLISENVDDPAPDPNRVFSIDNGHYQGTLVYVIGESGYQPTTYWYVRVRYGSCSGCDTLRSIRGHITGQQPTEDQTDQYMRVALHIIQSLRQMDPESTAI